MCELCDGVVTAEQYFGLSPRSPRRRMLREATDREVFRHRRFGWWGFDCHLCRYRVEGIDSRLQADFDLLWHCYEVHRRE